MQNKSHILLLEDDRNLGLMISEHLKMSGFEISLCRDGKQGLETFEAGAFDLCLVDVMMPKLDGFTFARKVRESQNDIPLIFLTAKSLQEDKIEGFKIGCDDYITKPFSVEELLLRINAVLKRAGKGTLAEARNSFEIGQYHFDSRRRILAGPKGEQKLTSKEADLLKLLCLNLNRTLQREVALKKIWEDEGYFTARSMHVFIVKLRKHLKDDDRVEIANVHGKGYKLMVHD